MGAEVTRKLVAEFVGTFALIFIGVGAIVLTQGEDIVAIALAHGLVIAVMVSAVGHISGGHFNPAVTFGFLVTRRFTLPEAGAYWAAQLAAAVLAALVLTLALPDGFTNPVQLGATLVNDDVGLAGAFAIEFVLTFFLGWVIFAVAVDERGSYGSVAGLPIGLVIVFDILAAGAFTGASMNPARTFGPDLVHGVFDDIWLYFVAPPLGAAAAMLLYDALVIRPRTADAPAPPA